MVQAARRRAAELGVANAEFRVVDAAAIELPDAAADGILCRFGLMLVPDVGAACREIMRVLRPGGRAALAVWAEPELNEWITAAGRAALALGLLERPDPDEPGPFRLADPRRLRALVEEAGLEVRVLEDVPVVWRAASLDEWWETTLDTSRMLSQLAARVSTAELAAVRRGAEEQLVGYVSPDGSLAVPGVARALLSVRPG